MVAVSGHIGDFDYRQQHRLDFGAEIRLAKPDHQQFERPHQRMVGDDFGVGVGICDRPHRFYIFVFLGVFCRLARMFELGLQPPWRLCRVGGVFLCRLARAILFRAHRLVWHVCHLHTRVRLLAVADFGRLVRRSYPLSRPHRQNPMVADGERVLYFARAVFTEFENPQFRPKHLVGNLPDCGGTSQ